MKSCYLAFFIKDRSFEYKKLQCFALKNKSSIWIGNKDALELNLLDNNHKQEEKIPEVMCLHGSNLFKEELYLPDLPLLEGTSLAAINFLLHEYLNKYSWTILPWGSIYSHDLLSMFVFITSDQKYFDEYMNSYPNQMSIKSHYGHIIPQCNMLISHYQVKTDFSEVAQAILIEEDFDDPESLIWDACQLDSCPPLLISEVYCSDETDDFYEIEDPDPDSPIYWERVNYKPLRIIDVHFKEKNSIFYPDNNKKFGIYQPQDKQSFINICRSLRQGTETLIFVPHDTNIEKLSELLSKIEASDYSKYSDLSYMQDILQTTEWFYGLDRNYVDLGDNMYSLFVSKDNKLIQRIDSMNTDYQSKLISFF